MPNKMLIDATHPEETRVVVVRGNRVEEFDFETAQRKQLRGNIYLAKVTRVEPSLQAAFIEYGGNRHGFLAFSEIHPDYYQIPVADRQALIEADERAHREAEEENENRSNRRRSRHRNSRRRGNGERVQSEIIENSSLEPQVAGEPEDAYEQAAHDFHEHEPAQHGDAEPHFGGADHHDEPGDQQPSHEHDHDAHDEHAHANDERGEVHAADTVEPVGESETPAAADQAADAEAAASAQTYEENAHDEAGHAQDDVGDVAHANEASRAETGLEEHPEHGGDEHPASSVEMPSTVAEANESHDDDDEGDEVEEEVVESVGGDDVLEEVPERPFRPRRQYKIQEVIKRRQVMLVQVVKEERGNKGAALTTYLSLAGRYAVLMPNTARGGGISRKITSAQDRSRLKEVVQDLDVPEGMGIILRTAGASRTKQEIKRDFE